MYRRISLLRAVWRQQTIDQADLLIPKLLFLAVQIFALKAASEAGSQFSFLGLRFCRLARTRCYPRPP